MSVFLFIWFLKVFLVFRVNGFQSEFKNCVDIHSLSSPKVGADLGKAKDGKGKKSDQRSKRKIHEISDLSDSDDLFDGIVLSDASAGDDGADDGDDSSVSGDDDDAKKKKKVAKLDSGHSSDVRSLFSVVDSEALSLD